MSDSRRTVRSLVVTAGLLAATLVTGDLIGHGVATVAAAPAPGDSVQWWLTTGDGARLLANMAPVAFGPDRSPAGAVTVDQTPGQAVIGVGAALTESSAVLLGALPAAQRAEVLESLFDPVRGAGLGVLRIPLGASDFALGDYTYDDVPPGEVDESLAAFGIDREREHLLPLLTEALAVNPSIQVVLTPWSAPAWMKTSGSTHGGRLAPGREDVYAAYLVRAVAAFREQGVPVTTLTLANEPGHESAGYPSMLVDLAQQARVALEVRRLLDDSGLTDVGILAHDHNWDGAEAATALLTGAAGDAYRGAAFHCYAGDVGAQSSVAAAAPGAEVWTTECSGGNWSDSWAGDLRWGARHVLVGGFRNRSSAVLWWNLALDPSGGPANGGCSGCRGVLTVDPATGAVARSVEYWLLAHAGRFLPPGSVWLGTPERTAAGVESAAFLTPAGGHVLLLLNDGTADADVVVRAGGRAASLPVPAGGLVTATW
ncbi:glycoside hydrolase family 30 protein [Blastococcus sp. SYSU D00820]